MSLGLVAWEASRRNLAVYLEEFSVTQNWPWERNSHSNKWENITLTLSVLIKRSAVEKSEWRPCFLFLFIACSLVVRLTRNQVQMKEN
jgi:hypothetical protein